MRTGFGRTWTYRSSSNVSRRRGLRDMTQRCEKADERECRRLERESSFPRQYDSHYEGWQSWFAVVDASRRWLTMAVRAISAATFARGGRLRSFSSLCAAIRMREEGCFPSPFDGKCAVLRCAALVGPARVELGRSLSTTLPRSYARDYYIAPQLRTRFGGGVALRHAGSSAGTRCTSDKATFGVWRTVATWFASSGAGMGWSSDEEYIRVWRDLPLRCAASDAGIE